MVKILSRAKNNEKTWSIFRRYTGAFYDGVLAGFIVHLCFRSAWVAKITFCLEFIWAYSNANTNRMERLHGLQEIAPDNCPFGHNSDDKWRTQGFIYLSLRGIHFGQQLEIMFASHKCERAALFIIMCVPICVCVCVALFGSFGIQRNAYAYLPVDYN